ncbi:hypothetical protein LTR53_002123 [Teratosphaeriaceae sp. CCFEE 6253]|nr:hypothetical protein LTR53_002123 [Teratosphaeriaceae sp. CCFEE 6253]
MAPAPVSAQVSSWAMMARKAAGEKVVQVRPNTWISEEKARRAGLQIVFMKDVWMTSRLAKALETGPGAFERLPAELRLLILNFIQTRPSQAVFLRGNRRGPATGINFPPLAYVSTMFRAQYITLAIETTMFILHSGPGNAAFQKWLSNTSLTLASLTYKHGFDAVKSLGFQFFSRYPHRNLDATAPNKDVELMLKCMNLQTVTMVWHGTELMHPQEIPKCVELLRKQYRLDRMLKLVNLKQIKLVKHDVDGYDTGVLSNLAEWFRSSIKDGSGQAPVVTIV